MSLDITSCLSNLVVMFELCRAFPIQLSVSLPWHQTGLPRSDKSSVVRSCCKSERNLLFSTDGSATRSTVISFAIEAARDGAESEEVADRCDGSGDHALKTDSPDVVVRDRPGDNDIEPSFPSISRFSRCDPEL